MKSDRVTSIRRHLFTQGYSSVAEIAEAVGASEPTVRRDLIEMEAQGLVARSHGGARIAEGAGEVAFETREQINLAAKRAIGEAAFQRLVPDTAVFLDAGTTVLQLARRLRLAPMPLKLFTNCLAVAQLLLPVPAVSVTLLGGTLRPQNASLVGPLAEEALGRLWFDQVFLGAGALSAEGEISSADGQEARLNAQMLGRGARVTVLADAAKFGTRLTWSVGRIGPGMTVISDGALSADWRARLGDWGAELALAEAA